MPTAEVIDGDILTQSSVKTAIGCLDVRLRGHDIHCHDAPGGTTMVIRRDGVETTIGITLYRIDPPVGMIHQMDANEARMIAKSLLALADELDAEMRKAH